MDILKALEHNLYIFFFVFFRILLLFFLFPVFSGTLLPTSLKIFISVILALALTPVVHFKLPHITSIYQLALIMLSDFVLIFLISLLFRIILAGLQVGGELVGYQMGFGMMA
jgi:flagellar biosynthetic protein FliR